MNGQLFGERSNTSDSVESTDKDPNSPIINSDPFVDKVPVDPALIHETPMGGTLAAVGPMNPPADEIPMFETPIQEIPMGGTLAAVGPMDETIVHAAPMGETIPYKPLMGETIADESLVSTSIPYTAPMGETMAYEAPISTNAVSSATLLDRVESENFRLRWNDIQGKFVDEPRVAVQEADALVSEVIEHITHAFANEHRSLEVQWNHRDDVSTEDLRKALQHYRSFFKRLVV